jgi:hypothetical protein
MSEEREGSAVSTALILVVLLAGLALLCIVVVVGLGFLVSRTTLHQEMNLAMTAREQELRARELLELNLAQARAAEEERRRHEFEDGPTAPGAAPTPLDLDRLAKAQEAFFKYLEHLRAKRDAEAHQLLTADLKSGSQELTKELLPEKPPVLTAVKANARGYRLRFHGSFGSLGTQEVWVTVTPVGDQLLISAIDFDSSMGGAGAPGFGPGAGTPPPGGPNP